jgi:ABC-type nitrate/sulfonate/bicarbonate transport system substrate-binding protein
MASIATSDRLIKDHPDMAANAVRATVATQAALRAQPELAGEVGAKLFPPQEASLITDLIRRDLPYYDASISPAFVEGMNGFARDVGILSGHPAYEQVVATQFANLWKQ